MEKYKKKYESTSSNYEELIELIKNNATKIWSAQIRDSGGWIFSGDLSGDFRTASDGEILFTIKGRTGQICINPSSYISHKINNHILEVRTKHNTYSLVGYSGTFDK